MTSSPFQAPYRRVVILNAWDHDEVQQFLERDVIANLFMLSWMENYGLRAPGHPNLFQFIGVRENAELSGVSLIITGRLMFLDVCTADAAQEMARYCRRSGAVLAHIVSSKASVAPFWATYRDIPPAIEARLDRDQELYVLEREDWIHAGGPPEAHVPTALRVAEAADLESIYLASAKMHTEETLQNPLERDANHFRRHVIHRLESERTYAWFDEYRRLLFKADVSAQSRYGVQISGVYTPHDLRGRGIATRSMVDLCDALFQRGYPRVSLYVNVENQAALRVYEKVGFTKHIEYKTVFVETGE